MEDRPEEIAKLTQQLEAATRSGQAALWERLLARFTALRENPSQLRRWWTELSAPLQTVVQKWAGGIVKVLGYNQTYFEEFKPSDELITTVRSEILDRMGIGEKGQVLPGGYWDNVARDASVKQAVSEQLWRSKSLPEVKARTILKELILGTPDNPGVLEKNWSEYTFDVLHQTDRATQTAYANGLGMTASLYSGGIIAGSRPFCRARNGKVFLDEEVAKFGTSADKYPGYVNKTTGYFAGKPRTGYDPFTQLGGYRCRHFRSYISNAEAMRRRTDLKLLNGKLAIDPDLPP